jgi:hypothetical protein
MPHGGRTNWTSPLVEFKEYSQGNICPEGVQEICEKTFQREVIVLENNDFWKYLFTLCHSLYAPMRILQLADQKILAMDKLHYYVCQTDQLLAKYVKIAEGDSGHILKVDKSMENMRFMTNMNDQYTKESDNEEDSDDNVEDIDSGKKLVNVFDNDEDDVDDDGIMGKEDNVDVNSNKGGRQFVASCLSGTDFCR